MSKVSSYVNEVRSISAGDATMENFAEHSHLFSDEPWELWLQNVAINGGAEGTAHQGSLIQELSALPHSSMVAPLENFDVDEQSCHYGGAWISAH